MNFDHVPIETSTQNRLADVPIALKPRVFLRTSPSFAHHPLAGAELGPRCHSSNGSGTKIWGPPTLEEPFQGSKIPWDLPGDL